MLPLSLRRGRLWGGGGRAVTLKTHPLVLTFVIFILLIFPPIPCEGTQKGAANYLRGAFKDTMKKTPLEDLWRRGHFS